MLMEARHRSCMRPASYDGQVADAFMVQVSGTPAEGLHRPELRG